MKLGMNIPFKTQTKTEVKVAKNNWVDDIDRDIIPYIKEPEWKYSYPTKTAISISKEEKEYVENKAKIIFNAMNKTVKCVRNLPEFEKFNFIASKFDCTAHLARMDFVKDVFNNFKLVEINADTPCAIPESFYGNFIYTKDEESKQYINGELAQVFARLSTNNDDFFVFAANKEYQEDWYNAKYLHENLKRYFPELKSELVSLSDLEIFDDGVYFSGKKIDILYRLHPVEMLMEDVSDDGYPVGRKLIELHNEGKVVLVNSPEAIIMQDKRLFAIMTNFDNRFGFYTREELLAIYRMIPLTSTDKRLNLSEKVIAKPIYGREGYGISVFNKFEAHTIEDKDEEYIYQSFIEQPTVEAETVEGDKLTGYVTYSVFLLNGEPTAWYARFSPKEICDEEALWIPIEFK
ncbi:MAG: glutathionylspermidine synthase family protein [Megamonas funiformis]|jgi:glutathionylspermidine synthase|uniref:glutathionylspermidine synthase family protein n=1 Tax=Megamonas funiformis TaxID=437897 RepID=UPI001ECA8B7F|nr:glutathionylspermidine synthase family protein [Megamonas funiformis]MBS7213089.1 glutathionylspermidine synthase family protein [Megamonas funiformis]DAI87585.1 MAG TPA: Glutathionylspermidine synthase preATP-grasp [Caudoviricetes sp.]